MVFGRETEDTGPATAYIEMQQAAARDKRKKDEALTATGGEQGGR